MKAKEDDEESLLNRKSGSSSLSISESEGESAAGPDEGSTWPHVFNLANCIIGVSVLAMPYCFQQCGILLATLMIAICAVLTKVTCHFLTEAAINNRCISYENLAMVTLGHNGRRLTEACLLCFLGSSMVAFTVVIGDIGPHIVAEYLELEAPTQRLRTLVMVLVMIFVVLPLSIIDNLEKFSVISSLAVLFYGVFVVRMILEALPTIYAGEWSLHVVWWRSEGLLTCLPIVCMAMCCQTQLFPVLSCMKQSSTKRIDVVVSSAINVCSAIYAAVGVFGYVAFYSKELHGDVLVQFEPTLVTQFLKISFLLSVAVSIPLMLFPARTALFCLLLRPSGCELSASTIGKSTFHILTAVILLFNLVLAVLVPNVEFILGLTGAFIGTVVATILPSSMYIASYSDHRHRHKSGSNLLIAKACLVAGIFILFTSTWAILHVENKTTLLEKPIPKDAVLDNSMLESLEKLEQKVIISNNNISAKLDDISALAVNGKDKEAVELLIKMKEQQRMQQELIEKQEHIVAELNKQAFVASSAETKTGLPASNSSAKAPLVAERTNSSAQSAIA